jgi:hypothetical protein
VLVFLEKSQIGPCLQPPAPPPAFFRARDPAASPAIFRAASRPRAALLHPTWLLARLPATPAAPVGSPPPRHVELPAPRPPRGRGCLTGHGDGAVGMWLAARLLSLPRCRTTPPYKTPIEDSLASHHFLLPHERQAERRAIRRKILAAPPYPVSIAALQGFLTTSAWPSTHPAKIAFLLGRNRKKPCRLCRRRNPSHLHADDPLLPHLQPNQVPE